MKKIKIIFILVLITSCNTVSDVGKVMRNEKTTTTDEFLVKKKDPLILPPEYDKLPVPNSKGSRDSNSIQSALKSSKDSKVETKVSSNLEKMILKELRN